jgi:hypothetical protein
MICPKCGEEDTRSEINMTYILDLLHGAVCDRCQQYSAEFAWRWINFAVSTSSRTMLDDQETQQTKNKES